MKPFHAVYLLFAALSAVGAWRLSTSLPFLPEYIATTFGGDGLAKGWMSHSLFVGSVVAAWGLIAVSIAALRFRLARRAASFPPTTTLATPEGRDAFAIRVELLGVLTLVVCLIVLELVYAANFMEVPTLRTGPFLAVLGIYGLFVLGGVLALRSSVSRSP